jgi:cytochrome c2
MEARMRPAWSRGHGLAAAAVVLVVACAAGAVDHVQYRQDVHRKAEILTGGDVHRGEAAFLRYGCGGCHSMDGVPQAVGKVGPALNDTGGQAVIGGRLANTPGNMTNWIMNPQQVSPGTAMPDLGVTPADARDIAAFLYGSS